MGMVIGAGNPRDFVGHVGGDGFMRLFQSAGRASRCRMP
jgi:hypothetical protein